MTLVNHFGGVPHEILFDNMKTVVCHAISPKMYNYTIDTTCDLATA